MTYEEKLLEVFSRYRGEALQADTLSAIEKACQKEVWDHLPARVRNAWKLGLELSASRPGQIDLCPKGSGDVSAKELESALKATFVRQEPPAGGVHIGGFSMSFSGDVNNPEDHPARVAESSLPADAAAIRVKESSPSPAPQAATPQVATPQVATPQVATPQAAQETHSAVATSAREIEDQAKALGISLPPNSSLLGPFLEALSAATEYKRRAELAEQALAKLGV
jgi:hypothetical protein